MSILLQLLVCFAGIYAFSVLLSAPRKALVFCSLGGSVTWGIYLMLLETTGMNSLAVFSATFALAIYSRVLSVLCKMPVITFVTPGVFTLVPGAGIYYSAYYLFTENRSMAGVKGAETLVTAGLIALGLLLGFGIPQSLFEKLKKR